MNRRVRQRISSYLSAALLLTLLSTGIVAPEITAEQASANLTQPASPSLDLNNECDQNYISTTAGVAIQKIGNDCVIQFRAVGTYSWRVPNGLSNISRLLVVGGGGAGGLRHGGGGGAGGYVYKENVEVLPHSTLAIVVGDGGGRAVARGANGQDSLFNNAFRAKGGGGGADNNSQSGVAGGSGGGSTGPDGVPGVSNQAATDGALVRGSSGGRGTGNRTGSANFWTGGGGGGSSSAGETTNGAVNKGGNGGAGTLNDITGELICYAAGGGGGTNQLGTPGKGGSCIRPTDSAVITSGAPGGNNAWEASYERNLDASPSTGSGGGGGGYNGSRSELGGAGGRGIVVIRYALQTAAIDLNAANYSGSGTNWPDTSTGKNNGTLQGSPSFVPASETNPAHFRFDGTRSQYVSTSRFIPAAGPLNFSGGVWFRTTSNQAAKIIGFENTQTGTGTGSYDRHLYIGTDNRLYWGVFDGTARTVRTSQKVNDGKWHYAFFTSTWVYGGRVISLSLDNGPAVSLSHPNRAQDYGGWWRIGGYMLNGWPNARTGYFTGDIARATIYSWVLSPEQAREKYLEMYAPIKVTARASTTQTGIDVSWNRIPDVSSYQVQVYNEAGTTKVGTPVTVSNVESTTITAGIVANTAYRVTVTPVSWQSNKRIFSSESERSDVVVPASANCAPTQTFSGPYTVLRFNTADNKTSSCRWTVPAISTPLEYLVVGGGGGGGQNHGAGGQGGYYNAGELRNVSNSTVTITVGAGGTGGYDNYINNSSNTVANELRNGRDGSQSGLTTSNSAILASGGAGGVTTWSDFKCRSANGIVSSWNPAKRGTPVVGRYGLAGGAGGAPTTTTGTRNAGTTGFTSLSLRFDLFDTFASGGRGGFFHSSDASALLGNSAAAHTGNGGDGGDSACRGGGTGGSGTVILRYLTPLPKAPSPLITLPDTMNTALYARFQASDYNTISRTWRDSSGKGRDIYTSSGNPQLQVVKVGTNNAKNDFVAVTGSTNVTIPFFALPKNYTLFHVARYNGSNRQRIFNGVGTNWLSGFWANRVGVAFHNDWLTANGLADNKNPDTDWIVSTDKRNSYRSQGVDRTLKNASYQFGPLTRFGINEGDLDEKSDFQVAEVIIYDRELSDTEVAQVETYLQRKYTYQNPDIVGNVAGGGWIPSQYCPSGQIAVGVKAHINNGGFSRFQMICHSIAIGGTQTSGVDALTSKTDVGNATSSESSIYCKGSSGTQTSVIKGIRFARGNGLGTQDYYVGGLRLLCGPLSGVNQSTTESAFFGPAGGAGIDTQTTTRAQYTYYPSPSNPAQCPSGQVVVGFNAKSGSVTDAIQIICGIPPLAQPSKPTLDSATVTTLKTLVASWTAVPGAASYTVELLSSSGSLLETTGLSSLTNSETSVVISAANYPEMLNATAYRIRVTANGDGIGTLFSPASENSEPAFTLPPAQKPTVNKPTLGGAVDSGTVIAGNTVSLNVTASTTDVGGVLTYQWRKNGSHITGETKTSLVLTNVNFESSGAYDVVVTSTLSNGSSDFETSAKFDLYVLEVFTPKVGIVSKKDAFTLTVEARGTGTKSYSFVDTATALTPVTSDSATINTSTGTITVPTESRTGTINLRVRVTLNDTFASTAAFTVTFVDSSLATPTGVTLKAGDQLKTLVATWDKVDTATGYSVLLYDSSNALVKTRDLESITAISAGIATDSRSVTITTANYPGLADGETYTVKVIALDSTARYADSDPSASSTIGTTALPVSALNTEVTVTREGSGGELKISGSSVTFKATPSGTGGGQVSYQWFRNGTPVISGGELSIVSSNDSSTLTIARIQNSDAGLYTVEISNLLFGETATAVSNGQSISVVDGVKIVTPINGLVTTSGKPFRLQLRTTTGTAPITYSVDPAYPMPNGLQLISESALVVTKPEGPVLAQGFYPLRIVAKDANDSYDTTTVFTISVVESQLDSATVTAVPTANTLTSINVSWTAVANANRYLVRLYDSVTTTSSVPLAEVSGITGTSYTFTKSDYVQLADSTKYKVVVVALDASGRYGDSDESIAAEVTTNTPPSAPQFTLSPVAESTVNLGSAVTLTSNASSPAGTITYRWFKDEVEIPGATLQNYAISAVKERDAGTYSVVATSTLNGVSLSTTAETKTVLSIAFSVETPTVGLTAAVGKPYSLGIRTVGGLAAKTYLAAADSFPAGLKIDENTGEISGTPEATTTGSLIAVDVKSGDTTIRISFTIKVVIPSRTQITAVTAEATPGVLKSIQVDWTKADATIHLIHIYDSGDRLLKEFVAYDTATGTSFTITDQQYAGIQDGTEYKIGIIGVGNDTTANSEESALKTVKTNSAPVRPTIVSQPTTQFVVIGSPLTFSVTATKDDSGVLSYQWFKGANIIPGAISDSFTVAALTSSDVASYSVRVTNTLNGATSIVNSQNVSVVVLTDLDAITPTSGLKVATGVPYTLALSSTGGAGAKTWSIVDGILPSGLTFDSITALIRGTVSESITAGTAFTITAEVRDINNATAKTEPFVITLVDSASALATPTWTTTEATLDTTKSITLAWTTVPNATSYSVYLYTSSDTPIATTGLTGLTGSSIASTTINVNNYPEIAENTTYKVGVVANYDGNGAFGASRESVRESVKTGSNLTPPPPSPTPTAPPSNNDGTAGAVVTPVAPTPQVGPAITIIPGAPFNLQVNAPGANTFTINGGALPAGLTLDPRTGLITGTPTASGPYSFTILATPPLPGTLITYSGNIVAPPAPTVAPQETIRPGEPVNIQVNVPGANNFTVFGGSLPAGLTIDPRTGLITGTPTQTGPYDFTILATPPAQGTLVRFTGNVEAPAPTPQPVAPIELRPGTAFDFTPSVPGANNFALRDGTLPAGLTLDPATGRISGTPRESGPYSFSIIATPPANGVLLTFSGTIEAPNSTVVEPVVTPTLQTLDPITPATAVIPQANSNLLVVSSGATGNTTVLANTTSNGLIITSSEVVLSVAGIRANGNPLPLTTGNQLTVQAGLKVEASGSGFLPNSEVFVYMFSTPQLIGKVKVDANGNYSEQLTVPTTLSGNHVLQVNGFLKSNEVKSISIAVIVTKDETKKKPTTKPAATKDKKIAIGAKGVVVPFKGKVVSLSAANKKLIKQLQMPSNKSKEIYVLGYARNTGVPNDILVALNRAINVSKEIKRLNPKVKVGYAGLGTRISPVCAKQKNICAVVTIR